jgi:type VI secretion system protein ImpL
MPFDFPTGLPGILSLTLGAILVVIAVLLLVLGALLRRSREAATYADFTGSGPGTALEGVETPGPLKVADLRTSPSAGSLRKSFGRSLVLLRESLPGRSPRYQLPWFLIVGQTAAGKTTLLGDTEVGLPHGAPEEPGRRGSEVCRWWLFDRAVVLDIAGDLVLRLDGASSDQPAWTGLLKQLRGVRAKRPLDGALLAIPVTELLGFDPADTRSRSDLARRAELLRSRLDQARRMLEIRFPVYVLVTQCDRLPGFADLIATLDAGQLRQMFGWSNPNPPDRPYSPSWVDDAFASVAGALDRQQLRAVREGIPLVPVGDVQSFLALPAAVVSLREALRIYWNQLFSDVADSDALPVRGLYFSGGEGFDVPARGTPHHLPWDSIAPLRSWEDSHRRVDFLADLFSHKILAEWNLARPAEDAVRRRLRTRTALQGCLAVALIAGPPLLWWSGRQTKDNAEILLRRFLEPARKSLTHARRGTTTRQDASSLLNAANDVGDYTLRTPFLPASWWSSYPGAIARTGTAAYEKVVFPALEGSLQSKLQDLADGPKASSVRTVTTDLDSVPEYRLLNDTMAQVGALQKNVDRYDFFVSGRCAAGEADWLQDLQKLVDGFDPGIRLDPPTPAARRYYRRILCEAGANPRFEADPSYSYTADLLKSRVSSLGTTMLGNLFGRHLLAGDLGLLQQQINQLARKPPAPAQAPQTYQELVDRIDRTKEDLGLPTVAWAGKESLRLGPGYQKLLNTIAASRFVGPVVSDQIKTAGQTGFTGFQDTLNGFSADAIGPLLAPPKNAIGSLLAPPKGTTVDLHLASNVLGLETALKGLLKQFVQPSQGPRLTFVPPAGTYLSWNSDLLAKADGLLKDYQSFMSQSFKGFPGFQQVVDASSRGTVELNVLDQVAGAQLYPVVPDLPTRELREQFLQLQVANLTAAAGSLNNLLLGFTKPPAVTGCAGQEGTAYCQLNSVLLAQKLALLQQLDTLFEAQGLYVPSLKGIVSWNGSGNLAWSAFGAQNAAGLNAYLASERQIVQTLSNAYATPILTAVQTRDDKSITASPAYRRWTLINSDLADYQGKKPNNALQLLEGFIGKDMSEVTAGTCLGVTPTPGSCFAETTPAALTVNAPPCDFFLDRLTRLQTGVQQRCETIILTQGEVAYGKIATSFTERLSGKFPFASARSEVTPADLKRFFAVYDRERPAVDNLLAVASQENPRAPWSPETAEKIELFLDQMQKVRDFFASFLGTPPGVKPAVAATDAPTYSVAVDLRPAPAQEKQGDQIIERKAKIDQLTVQSPPAPAPSPAPTPAPATAPRWSYGAPVQVSLRWAQNGPRVPLLPERNPNVRVEERTVIYDYTDPWALLRLLVEHAPSPDDPVGTQVFQIPTEPAPASPGAETPAGGAPATRSQARLFLRLSLMAPDAAQTPLTLPAFPDKVPVPPGR